MAAQWTCRRAHVNAPKATMEPTAAPASSNKQTAKMAPSSSRANANASVTKAQQQREIGRGSCVGNVHMQVAKMAGW